MKRKYYYLAFLIATFSLSVSGQTTSESLQQLTSKKRDYNQNTKNGFCIQLYNGNEEDVIKKLAEFRSLFPEIKVKRIYKVPEWKIQTLTYKTRIEADRVLNAINEEYPGARVL